MTDTQLIAILVPVVVASIISFIFSYFFNIKNFKQQVKLNHDNHNRQIKLNEDNHAKQLQVNEDNHMQQLKLNLETYRQQLKLNRDNHQVSLRYDKSVEIISIIQKLRDNIDMFFQSTKIEYINYIKDINYVKPSLYMGNPEIALLDDINIFNSKLSHLLDIFGLLYGISKYDFEEIMYAHNSILDLALNVQKCKNHPELLESEKGNLANQHIKMEELWYKARPNLTYIYDTVKQKIQEDLK